MMSLDDWVEIFCVVVIVGCLVGIYIDGRYEKRRQQRRYEEWKRRNKL